MVKLYYGAEPYLIAVQLKKDMSGIASEFDIGTYDELTTDVLDVAGSMPMFSDRRLTVIKLADTRNSLLPVLFGLDTENEIRVVASEVDARTSFFRNLRPAQKQEFGKLSEEAFRNFLLSRAGHFGVKFTDDGFEEFRERMAYESDPLCSLYTVECYLRALANLEKVDVPAVAECVPRFFTEKAFELYSYLTRHDADGYFGLLKTSGDPIQVLSLLLYNFRLEYKASLVGKDDASRELGISQYQVRRITGCPADKALAAMSLLQGAVGRIKSGEPGDDVLTVTSSQLFSMV